MGREQFTPHRCKALGEKLRLLYPDELVKIGLELNLFSSEEEARRVPTDKLLTRVFERAWDGDKLEPLELAVITSTKAGLGTIPKNRKTRRAEARVRR